MIETILYKLSRIEPIVYFRWLFILAAVCGFATSLLVPIAVELFDRIKGKGKHSSLRIASLSDEVQKLKARVLDLQDALRDTENERDELRLLVDSKRTYARDWLERADSMRRRA